MSGKPEEEAAAAREPGRRSALEALLALAALAMGAWVAASTLEAVRGAYLPFPSWDEWDYWSDFVGGRRGIGWFVRQHVDHRLVFPSILFALDRALFAGRQWFLLGCTVALQALTALVVWRLYARTAPARPAERACTAGVILAGLFSAQQYINFIWAFQVQFPMVYAASLGALFALLRGHEAEDEGRRRRWVAAALGLGVAATYTMASGILVWPALLLLALWLRMGAGRMQAIGLAAAGAVGIYFIGWNWSSRGAGLGVFERLRRAVVFGLVQLGSPFEPAASLAGREWLTLGLAATAGAVGAAGFAWAYFNLWRRREGQSGGRAALLHACLLGAGASALMAVGRSAGNAADAFTPRYRTPALFFWVCLTLASWPWLRRLRPRLVYAGLALAVLAAGALPQPRYVEAARHWAQEMRRGMTAAVAGVVDGPAWWHVYHTPVRALPALDYLRAHRLSAFREEWTQWLGVPLSRRFFVDPSPGGCQGEFESAVPTGGEVRPGWRTAGWAWDVKGARAPQFVILADNSGVVAGVALTGFAQPAGLAALDASLTGSPWLGYVSGRPRTITAYVLHADGRTLCGIGSRRLRQTGGELPFARLGPPLPLTPPEIQGGWTPEGQNPEAGKLPAAGPAYGSWSGSDAKTGVLRMGPFRLERGAELAIPVVTGPHNGGLSVSVLEAGKPLARLSPPPVRGVWWAWLPELPEDRELTVEVVAEDRGSGWGEWLAVGWPQAVRPEAAR